MLSRVPLPLPRRQQSESESARARGRESARARERGAGVHTALASATTTTTSTTERESARERECTHTPSLAQQPRRQERLPLGGSERGREGGSGPFILYLPPPLSLPPPLARPPRRRRPRPPPPRFGRATGLPPSAPCRSGAVRASVTTAVVVVRGRGDCRVGLGGDARAAAADARVGVVRAAW